MEILKAAIPAPVLSALTAKQAWHYRIVPFESSDDLLNCYIDHQSIIGGLEDELELLIGKKILLEQMESGEVEELLKKHYPFQQSDSRQQSSFYDGDGDHFLSHLISEAKALNSSDIHIEAFESKCRVRIRVD